MSADIEKCMAALKVLFEARQWGRGGEVVLRCDAKTGRVFFVGGKIAWAAVSTSKKNFLAYLVERSSLSKAQLKKVFEECKHTGKNFGETIVEWGLLDEPTLRHFLLQHLSECLLEMFSWPSIESMFVPEQRAYKGNITFDLEEVLQTVIDNDWEGKSNFGGRTAKGVLELLEKQPALFSPAEGAAAIEQALGGSSTDPPLDGAAPGKTGLPLRRGVTEQLTGLFGEFEDSGPTVKTAPPRLAEQLGWIEKHAGRGPIGRGALAVIAGVGALLLLGGAALIYWHWESTPSASTKAGAHKQGQKTEPKPSATGQVKIASTPPGARVYLDEVMQAGRTPTQIGRVQPGTKHALRVILEGWQPWETRFVLTNTAKPLEFEALLLKLKAQPKAQEKPGPSSGAEAADPLASRAPTKGAAQGSEASTIVPGASGKGKGTILVTSKPARAVIFLDGVLTGMRTPATLRNVSAGLPHVIQVVQKGFKPAYESLRVGRNKTAKVRLVLKRGAARAGETASVRVESEPRGAAVFVDGKRVKRPTPVELKLSTKKPAKIEVKLKGHATWGRVVSPVPNLKLALSAKLRRGR